MYTRILVPLDGSDLAAQALPRAEELARLMGAPVSLIQIVDPHRLDHFGLDKFVGQAKFEERLETVERTALDELQTTAMELEAKGLTASAEVRRGDPARELVAAAEPGDIIVIATHGRDGAKRWFLGSVAEAVTRHAAVPVLLVRVQPTERQVDDERYADLLRHDAYRPDELAQLLNMDVALVRQAALTGRLHATVADHHVISITRADALSWLAERG